MAKGRVRKQPQRTCIACRRVAPKRELIRIVLTPSGEILVDTTGKLGGRGAYLCPTRECWLLGLQRRRIGAALKRALTPDERAQLEAYAEQLPQAQSSEGEPTQGNA